MDNTVTISNILSVHSSGIKDIHIVRSSPPSIPRFFFSQTETLTLTLNLTVSIKQQSTMISCPLQGPHPLPTYHSFYFLSLGI